MPLFQKKFNLWAAEVTVNRSRQVIGRYPTEAMALEAEEDWLADPKNYSYEQWVKRLKAAGNRVKPGIPRSPVVAIYRPRPLSDVELGIEEAGGSGYGHQYSSYLRKTNL